VHLTLDLAGKPVRSRREWVDTVDYAVDPARAERFYPAIRATGPICRRRADAELFRHSPQNRAAGGSQAGFPDPGAADHGSRLINLFGSSRRD